MAITKEFIEAVESGKALRVRIMLKDILDNHKHNGNVKGIVTHSR